MENLNTKWVATLASIWIQCALGACYTFGIYSSTLKASQSYDQSTLNIVSVFKDIGSNAGILPGLLYSAVAHKNVNRRYFSGPWVVHLAGAVQCFLGYFLIWASVVGLIDKPPVPLMCLFMFLAAHAQTFFNTANVVTGVENFSDYGGTIVGILKGFLGLSGAMLILLYETVCNGRPTTYILVLAVTPTVVTLILMSFVRIYRTSTIDDKKHLDGFSLIALIIAAYLMVIIIMDNVFGFPQWAHVISSVFLILLLASPLRIVKNAHSIISSQPSYSPEKCPLLADTENHDEKQLKVTLGEEEDMNLFQAMSTLNFWLLFIAMICGMGSGIATINNISQIAYSLRYTTIESNSLVSLLSIWNFIGRFGAGYVSDVLLRTKSWPRPLFMAITLATMTIGHLIIALGFPGNLYVGSIVVGVCYGSQWSLMPTITSEIFGIGHMGTIFNTIGIAGPVGSYFFSVRVLGYIYDKNASGDDKSCYGVHCFMLSFLIMASVAFFGFLVALALFFRTKMFYSQVVLRRLHHS